MYCKCERAQGALKLLPPPSPVSTTLHAAPSPPRDEPLSAMVSTKKEKSQADRSDELFDAIRQLSKDVQALKLHVAAQEHNVSHSKHDNHSDYSRGDRGRDRYRRTPSMSPVWDARSSTPSYHRSSRSHADNHFSRGSPDHCYSRHPRESSFSPRRQDHPYNYERPSRPRSPERWHSNRGDRSSPYCDYDRDSTYNSGRHRSPPCTFRQ